MAEEELIRMVESSLLSYDTQTLYVKNVAEEEEEFDPLSSDDFLSPQMIIESVEEEVDDEGYDSKKDTNAHIKIVRENMAVIIDELRERAKHHDESKLKEPEKSCYDKFIPELKKTKYGTKEYYAVKKDMGAGLEHHFKANRHHPEHFNDGVNDMNLVDLIEMFIDWYSASLRSDTGFEKGLESNVKTHKLNKQLAGIFLNTYKDLFS